MYTGYGSATPPLTNNPFSPQTGQSVGSRFPDISIGAAWPPNGSGRNSLYQQQTGLHQQQQLSIQNGYGTLGYGSNGVPTSPSTSGFPPSLPFQTQGYANPFGQQQQQQQQVTPSSAPHLSGSSYSYLTGQQSQLSTPSYMPAQQQLQTNLGYMAQFDPYSAIGQGWGASSSPINQISSPNLGGQVSASSSTGSTFPSSSSMATMATATSSASVGPKGDLHPKDYIRTHKAEIERWDAQAWKQLLNTFGALQNAWGARKEELMVRAKAVISQGQTGMAYGGYFAQQIQQEAARLQQLLKEAESNSDSIAASIFQMEEVFQGYRQSGDAASKHRVREATNAALNSLPGWPQPL